MITVTLGTGQVDDIEHAASHGERDAEEDGTDAVGSGRHAEVMNEHRQLMIQERR